MKANENLAGKQILITGGSGYIAAGIIRALRDVPCRIVRLARRPLPADRLTGVAVIEDSVGDVRDPNVWNRVLPRTDVVFHLAVQTSAHRAEEDPVADLQTSVAPTLLLLESCRRLGARPVVVFASTVTVAGIPTKLPVDESFPDAPATVYDLHKQMAEQYIRYYAREGLVPGVTLRLANVYGAGPKSSSAERGVLNQMVARALAGEPLTVYGSGNVLRDYVYIDDVAEAFLRATRIADDAKGAYYVIGTGKGHTIAEAIRLVAEKASARTGNPVQVEHVPPPRQSRIESRDFVGEPAAFMRSTGWRPMVPLEAGIDLMLSGAQ